MRDGNFVFSSIRVVVSSFEISWNSSCGALIRSLASWKYINLSIAKCFGLLCKGIFARCRWIITKLLRKSRCHLQWPSRTHTWQSHRFSCNHPRLPPYFVIFWPTPYFSLLRRSFCLSDRSCISCLTAFTFSVVQGDTVWIHHLCYKKQICILLNSAGVELQLIDLWVRKYIVTLALWSAWEEEEGGGRRSWNLLPTIWGGWKKSYILLGRDPRVCFLDLF